MENQDVNSKINRCQYVLTCMEDCIGLHSFHNGTSLEESPIEELLNSYSINSVSKENIKELKNCAMKLSYLDSVSNFNRDEILDFQRHKRVDILATLLSNYRTNKSVPKDIKDDLSSLVSYLIVLENKNKKMINSMSYRYIRLFIITLLLEDFVTSSILSNFLINQIFLGRGILTSLLYKVNSKKKSKKSLDKLETTYKEKRANFNGSDYEEMGFIDKTKDTVIDIKDKAKVVKKSMAGFVDLAKETMDNVSNTKNTVRRLKFSSGFRIPNNLDSRKEVDLQNISKNIIEYWDLMEKNKKSKIEERLIVILGLSYAKINSDFDRWLNNEKANMRKQGIVLGMKDAQIKKDIVNEVKKVLAEKAPFIWRNRTKELEQTVLKEWVKLVKEEM